MTNNEFESNDKLINGTSLFVLLGELSQVHWVHFEGYWLCYLGKLEFGDKRPQHICNML